MTRRRFGGLAQVVTAVTAAGRLATYPCHHEENARECVVQQGTTMKTADARIAIAFGIIFSVATFNTGFAAYIPTNELESHQSDATKKTVDSQTEFHCLALAVYFEGGSTAESEDGQRRIARVVIERAKEDQRKWGGSKLCDVVFYKRAGVCQFSFACLPLGRRTPHGSATWQRSLSIAQEELEAKSEVGDDGIRYYLNPALTSNRNVCRFRREFVPVVEAGRHQFFREPTAEERAALAKSEFAECKDAKNGAAKLSADKKKRFAAISKKISKVRVARR
jgi:hypothetical protein